MNKQRAINLGKIAANDGLAIMATAKMVEQMGGNEEHQQLAVEARREQLVEINGGMGYRTAPTL